MCGGGWGHSQSSQKIIKTMGFMEAKGGVLRRSLLCPLGPEAQKMWMEKLPMDWMISKYSLTQPHGRQMIPFHLLNPLKN